MPPQLRALLMPRSILLLPLGRLQIALLAQFCRDRSSPGTVGLPRVAPPWPGTGRAMLFDLVPPPDCGKMAADDSREATMKLLCRLDALQLRVVEGLAQTRCDQRPNAPAFKQLLSTLLRQLSNLREGGLNNSTMLDLFFHRRRRAHRGK